MSPQDKRDSIEKRAIQSQSARSAQRFLKSTTQTPRHKEKRGGLGDFVSSWLRKVSADSALSAVKRFSAMESKRLLVTLSFLFSLALAWLAFPGVAWACPMCKDAVEANPQLATSYSWSVLLLVGAPFLVIAVVLSRTARALNPIGYQAFKQQVKNFLWPRGWLYISSIVAVATFLFYVTTPPDPATQLQLSSARLENFSTVETSPALPRLEGRVTLVTFFASWCPPCVEEMVDLNTLRQAFSADELSIVAVNAFENYAPPPGVPHLHADGTLEFHVGAPSLPNFIEANQISVPVVVSTPELLGAFGNIERIPTILIFNSEGRLIKRYVNPTRGDFVRPTREALQQDIQNVLACDRLSLGLLRQTCAQGWNLGLDVWGVG